MPRIISLAKPTQRYVKSLFDYDAGTGELRWNVTRSRTAHKGDIAGHHRIIRIDGRNYKTSHVIWLWMTGELPQKTIDHKDRNPLNNRWENLREATQSQQCMNRGIRSDNYSGCPGVIWRAKRQKWEVQIKADSRTISLGYFDDWDVAVTYRERHIGKYHGEFEVK